MLVGRQDRQVVLGQLIVAIVPGADLGERSVVDPRVHAARLIDLLGLGDARTQQNTGADYQFHCTHLFS